MKSGMIAAETLLITLNQAKNYLFMRKNFKKVGFIKSYMRLEMLNLALVGV